MRTNTHLLNMLPYSPSLINGLTTREAFYWARNKICQGRHTDAVKMICDAVVFELQNNPELSKRRKEGQSLSDVITTKNWPQVGASLIINDNVPTVQYTKDSFKPSEALSYYQFFKALLLQLAMLQRSTETGLLATWSKFRARAREFLAERIIQAVPESIESKIGRYYAFLLVGMRYKFGLVLDVMQSQREAELICNVFHEPLKRAGEIQRNYTKYMVTLRSNDWNSKHVDGFLERYVDSIVWEKEADYARLLDEHRGKSRVLTTLHFGLFRNALLRLGRHVEEGRTNITVTQYEDSYEQRQARNRFYADIKEDYRQYTTDQLDSRVLVKELRKGNTAVTLLFDMPAKSGESVEVKFLGRKARFAKGTAHIAITARVPIFPVFTYIKNGKSHLECREIIDTTLLPHEPFDDAVQRITQTLVRIAEEYISRHPHQWLLLNRLESYFVGENGLVPEDV